MTRSLDRPVPAAAAAGGGGVGHDLCRGGLGSAYGWGSSRRLTRLSLWVAAATLVALGLLGALGAQAGGAPRRRAALRVMVWGVARHAGHERHRRPGGAGVVVKAAGRASARHYRANARTSSPSTRATACPPCHTSSRAKLPRTHLRRRHAQHAGGRVEGHPSRTSYDLRAKIQVRDIYRDPPCTSAVGPRQRAVRASSSRPFRPQTPRGLQLVKRSAPVPPRDRGLRPPPPLASATSHAHDAGAAIERRIAQRPGSAAGGVDIWPPRSAD